MALAGKVKTALDETRTLILGAQILLGFQLQGPFRERFDSLPFRSRYISAIALALMGVAVGLLIAPSALHRTADRGESTGRMQMITTWLAAAALLPFSLALGLDITVTLELAWGSLGVSALAGAAFAGLAAAGWYGLGILMRRRLGASERGKMSKERNHCEPTPLHAKIEQMLTETRVILPGAQALLGFQLAIVMTSSFEKLSTMARLIHGLALLSVSLTVILLMTPAALHRIVWAGEDSETLLRVGGRITVLSLLPLAVGMAGDAYIVLERMTGLTKGAAAAAIILLVFLISLWFAWPFVDRVTRRGHGK